MIRFQELVPDYYIEKSRDFQVLCRLYDFAFNALKYNIDSMSSITDTRFAKDTILPLIGDKFGIYDKDSYSNRYLLEALPIALKYKGSLKAVNILINAFLDSEEVFEFATAFSSKDQKTADEISEILNREVKPHTIVIFLSDYPNTNNLHILDEYLQMVIPTGMVVEYMFGLNKKLFEKFRYKEYVFLFFAGDMSMRKYPNSIADSTTTHVPIVSLVKNKEEKYKGEPSSDIESASSFVQDVLSDIDINSVAIASVSTAPEEDENIK